MKFALCFLFSFVSLTTSARALLVDKVVGIVNSEVILLSDVDRFQKTIQLRQELDPIFGFSVGMEKGSPDKNQIIEFLVQERLVSQTFKVTDSEVEQEISSVQKNNRLSREDLVHFLRSKGFTYEEYFEIMRSGLQKRLLLDKEIRSRVNIGDDDVRSQYYSNYSKNEDAPMEYDISLITINARTYKTPAIAEKIAQETLAGIRNDEDFKSAAKRVSEDGSAEHGGAVGFVSSEQLAEPLKSAVKTLRVGAISSVIKTKTGFVIAQLNASRPIESAKFHEMKEQIREQLAKVEYKKQLYLWAERSKNSAYILINSLN